ncbi:MAG: hypothetical protein M1835_007105, partial [Candelina submexicana]
MVDSSAKALGPEAYASVFWGVGELARTINLTLGKIYMVMHNVHGVVRSNSGIDSEKGNTVPTLNIKSGVKLQLPRGGVINKKNWKTLLPLQKQ